jgi:hypothetical protein
MDRSADIILQKAFLELESFTIPGLGTFTRPQSRRLTDEILWSESDSQAYTLIDYLTEQEGKSASEADVIQANIRVALRSSLKLRNQYYIQDAGTIKQRGNHISFIPEPSVVDHWFPRKGVPAADTAPPAGPSIEKRIIVGAILVAFVLIVASGFWYNTNKPAEPTEKAKVIAGNDEPAIDTTTQEILDSLDDKPVVEEESEKQEKKPFLPEKSNYRIIPMEQYASRGIENSDTATAYYHIIAAVFSSIEAAENYCRDRITHPESCQFLPYKTEDGTTMYRVSVFQTQGSKAARGRRAFYRKEKFPDCWVFPPLPD